jgi:hypothetical protein
MKIEITRNRIFRRWDGETFPETETLFQFEAFKPESLVRQTGARFENDAYFTYPIWKKANRWKIDINFPSWFPTEGDGFVGLGMKYTKEDGFWMCFFWGRFTFGWASCDIGKPSLFTNRYGFSFCSCFATGLGG